MTREEALELLGLGRDPTVEEIKSAYTKLSLRYHPDRSAGATDEVKELAARHFRVLTQAKELLLGHAPADESAEAGHENPAEAAQVLERIAACANAGNWAGVTTLALLLANIPGYEQEARLYLAHACAHTGQLDTAVTTAEAATLAQPQDHRAWYALSFALAQREDWRPARKAIERAIKHSNGVDQEYLELRDAIDTHIVAGTPLSKLAEGLYRNSCPQCDSTAGFEGGRCKSCGYRSVTRAWAKQVAGGTKAAWDRHAPVTSSYSRYVLNPTNNPAELRAAERMPTHTRSGPSSDAIGCMAAIAAFALLVIVAMAFSPRCSAPEAKQLTNSADRSDSRQGDTSVEPSTRPHSKKPATNPDLAGRVPGTAEEAYEQAQALSDGDGVPKDPEAAARLFKLAAQAGHVAAMRELGICYNTGDGVPKDYSSAAHWFENAAEAGDAFAQLNIGICYERGTGVVRDDLKAQEWFRKAAAQGERRAMAKLK